MKSWLHNMLGRVWNALGALLQRTKKWDKTK